MCPPPPRPDSARPTKLIVYVQPQKDPVVVYLLIHLDGIVVKSLYIVRVRDTFEVFGVVRTTTTRCH